jgi:hypothetical protein
VAGRIRSIEKSNDLIGNRISDLPACSMVPQPTTVSCATHIMFIMNKTSMNQPQVLPLFRCFMYCSRDFDLDFGITNKTCFRK